MLQLDIANNQNLKFDSRTWLYIYGTVSSNLAPDCKPAPILAEHTVWEKQRNGPYSDWHSRFWTSDQGNEQTCCTIGQSAVTNDYFINIHDNIMINN